MTIYNSFFLFPFLFFLTDVNVFVVHLPILLVYHFLAFYVWYCGNECSNEYRRTENCCRCCYCCICAFTAKGMYCIWLKHKYIEAIPINGDYAMHHWWGATTAIETLRMKQNHVESININIVQYNEMIIPIHNLPIHWLTFALINDVLSSSSFSFTLWSWFIWMTAYTSVFVQIPHYKLISQLNSTKYPLTRI